MQSTYTLAALQDQPSRLFSNRSKPKAKIRIRGPFFLKKIRRRIVFYRGSITSFPKIILGNFYSVREACESRRCAIEPARRLERPKEETNLELVFIQSFIKQDAAPHHFVDREDDARKTYDARVKNKFKWEWLTEKDTHGDFLSSDIRKINTDGLDWCCFGRNSELQQ